MLILVNKIDTTSYIPYDSVNISQTAGDPIGKATFQIVDPTASLSISSLQEVIFIDETVAITPSGSTLVTSTPTHNYLDNNNFNSGSNSWTDIGSLTGHITYPSNPTFGAGALATLTFSNQAVGSDLAAQTLTNVGGGGDYTIPGQTYCYSGTINVTSNFTNSYALLRMDFLDVGGNVLQSTSTAHITTTSGAQRFSVQATAPANAVSLRAVFGGTTTNTTNSGTATFTALQFEPVWFPNLYSYPTPICDWLQSDSITIHDGTSTRYDRIFTGFISHYTVTYDGTTRIFDVEVTSTAGLLENTTLVNATYSNVTDASIIINLIDNLPAPLPMYAAVSNIAALTPQALAYRNQPVCYAGVTISDLQFADATLREVINTLSDITGFLFGVDPYYNVYYQPPFYAAAPYGFAGNGTQPDNVTTFPYYDYSIEYDATQIKNRIRVTGSTYPLQVTESFTAQDGSHTEFIGAGKTEGFIPFHSPSLDPTVSIGGTNYPCQLDTGNLVLGTNTSAYDPNYPKIFWNPSSSAGTSISVTYTYNALVYVLASSSQSSAQYGRRIYDKINDTNLTSNAAAATRGEAELQAYSQPRITLKFKTTKMLQPGQVINFTSTFDGLSAAHYTTQKVTAIYLGNGINQYEVEAGTYVDDFVDFFRNSQKAINRVSHDPNDAIQQYNDLPQDSISYSDSLNIH